MRVVFGALLVLGACVSGAAAAAGSGPQGLASRLGRALAVPHVAQTATGAEALDLETGAVVFVQNGSRPLAPASNEKLAVTLAALLDLGPGFRVDTDVLGVGEQLGPVWNGQLVLRGYGDPQLTSAGLARLAAQVRAAGIASVTGGIVADESFFDSRRIVTGWKRSFFMDESPPLSALIVDRGVYGGHMSTRPALAAGLLFRTALRTAGVSVGGPVTAGTAAAFETPLASIQSPPLWRILRFMDRESDNFTAELLLKQLGAVEAGRGTTAAGAAVVTRQLTAARVPLAGVRIVDGSGLSLLDRLTVSALVGTLQAAWADPRVRAPFLAALPVAGVNGTLEDRMRRAPARGNVLAKTGTTDRASGLAGFVRDRYLFAVLHNGHPVASSWARLAEDRFATVLAAQ